MANKKLVVAQSGGPSAVINSTLAGIINEAYNSNEINSVLGFENGLEGLFNNSIVDLSSITDEQINKLRETPGAILGCTRVPLENGDFDRIVKKLVDLQVDYFLHIGGNGTMYATNCIYESAKKLNVNIGIGGVPKTVDNDIVEIDHTPGFGSAAKFVARAVQDLALDLEAMKTFEQVRIIETMGRNVGWLAAATGLAKGGYNQAPHLIYLPEYAFDEKEFLAEVKSVVDKHGYGIVVIGEGIKDSNGDPIGAPPFSELIGKNQTYEGAALYLAGKISEELNIRSRSQSLGMAQRSFAAYRSDIDEREAYDIGRAAVQSLLSGGSGCMATVEKNNCESLKVKQIPLVKVGGKEKKVPANFYDLNTKQVTREFLEWLRPVVGICNQNYLYFDELSAYKEEA